jgi:hypothetical protein
VLPEGFGTGDAQLRFQKTATSLAGLGCCSSSSSMPRGGRGAILRITSCRSTLHRIGYSSGRAGRKSQALDGVNVGEKGLGVSTPPIQFISHGCIIEVQAIAISIQHPQSDRTPSDVDDRGGRGLAKRDSARAWVHSLHGVKDRRPETRCRRVNVAGPSRRGGRTTRRPVG